MKKFTSALFAVLVALALPIYAFADVAGVGTIIVFGLLPYVLIGAALVVAVVILIRYIRRKRKASGQRTDKAE